MDEYRNRGSPRLQFTREELENDALSRPIAKVEKAADKYEAAKEKTEKETSAAGSGGSSERACISL